MENHQSRYNLKQARVNHLVKNLEKESSLVEMEHFHRQRNKRNSVAFSHRTSMQTLKHQADVKHTMRMLENLG